MKVTGGKLGQPSHELKSIVNVKIDPTEIEILTQGVGFYPAYHMNKQHWVSIDIEQVEQRTVLSLIEQSYQLTNQWPTLQNSRTFLKNGLANFGFSAMILNKY